jgi:hypothetical protein
MFSLVLLLTSAANAGDLDGNVVTTELRTTRGGVKPSVFVGLVDPPDPDFENDGRVATTRVRFERSFDASVVIGIAEDTRGIVQLYYQPDSRSEPVVVWGKGAVDRFVPPDPYYPPDPCFPPDPYIPPDPYLPPGPCFELIAVLADGTELGISITITSENGWIDPASLVGFNPQPDPPGFPAAIQLDLSAASREGAALDVAISLCDGKTVLPLY